MVNLTIDGKQISASENTGIHILVNLRTQNRSRLHRKQSDHRSRHTGNTQSGGNKKYRDHNEITNAVITCRISSRILLTVIQLSVKCHRHMHSSNHRSRRTQYCSQHKCCFIRGRKQSHKYYQYAKYQDTKNQIHKCFILSL